MSEKTDDYQRGFDDGVKSTAECLVPFLAVWAESYQRDYKLDGLHPIHYDLLKKYGARMDGFKRAKVKGY